MKMRYFLMLSVSILLSCTSKSQEKTTQESTDSLTEEVVLEEGSFEQMLNDYRQLYKNDFKIDTIGVSKRDTFLVKLEHQCLFDSVTIPKKYSWSERPSDWIAHNFRSMISISSPSSKVLVEREVTKELFSKFLSTDVQTYGVLMEPTFRGFSEEKNTFGFFYSISIPMTDVGKGLLLEIGTDGKINISE
jgi:hypothetical protein